MEKTRRRCTSGDLQPPSVEAVEGFTAVLAVAGGKGRRAGRVCRGGDEFGGGREVVNPSWCAPAVPIASGRLCGELLLLLWIPTLALSIGLPILVVAAASSVTSLEILEARPASMRGAFRYQAPEWRKVPTSSKKEPRPCFSPPYFASTSQSLYNSIAILPRKMDKNI
jgi:hypothetical protein